MDWNKSLELIKNEVGDHIFYSWFAELRFISFEDGVLSINAPNDFVAETLRKRYSTVISKNVETLEEEFNGLKIGVEPAKNFKQRNTLYNAPSIKKKKSTKKKINSAEPNILLPHYTFNNMVIGKNSNHLACAAAQAVANNIADSKNNPLFIYGATGLGKTHLMHAIGNAISSQKPSTKICYTTGEIFLKDLIHSIQNKDSNKMDQKYRHGCDILLIDDVHILSGKDGMQDEFFNIFNHLHANQKQIVISADRSPYEIAGLHDRLRTRFSWGIMADIKIPDFVTRIAIINKKAELWNIEIPNEVAVFIAENFKRSVREIEGAIKQLILWSQVQNKNIDFAMCEEFLLPHIPKIENVISPELIISTVAKYYNLSPTEIKAKGRKKTISLARHICFYLIKKDCSKMSLQDIGDMFGGRAHATVINGINQIKDELKNNPILVNSIQTIERKYKD